MNDKWFVSPHTDDIQYLGGFRTSMDYRGCIVRTVGGWLVQPLDFWTEEEHTVHQVDTLEEARKALENVTPEGHKCEVFVNKTIGHCPERASVILPGPEGGISQTRGVMLCPVHSRIHMTDQRRTLITEWEAKHGPITHEGGPIIGERQLPPMRPVKRSHYLSKPRVWGDDWSGYKLGICMSDDIRPGALVVFTNDSGNAYEVESVDLVPIPDSEPLMRFNCNDGATYGTYSNRAVAVLYLPF
ncbi:hypothetical protein [Streptomyces pseudogriseolus]|uniref:hypothetical protein n=1 Tax=Streptomyces pseudogriseolus TaxID=36817 RepID=UPI003FA1F6A8